MAGSDKQRAKFFDSEFVDSGLTHYEMPCSYCGKMTQDPIIEEGDIWSCKDCWDRNEEMDTRLRGDL